MAPRFPMLRGFRKEAGLQGGEGGVEIIQIGAWDGNHPLQITGFTNLGEFSINANDTSSGNSILQTLVSKDIGIAQNPGNTTGNISLLTFGTGSIPFYTNGANEIMRIKSDRPPP
jgi:hypothetical protein